MTEDLVFDKNRRRVKECPCGKDNKGGRWSPYVGHDKFGWCHDCETVFLPSIESTKDAPIKNKKQKYIDPSVVVSYQENLIEDNFYKAFKDVFKSDSDCERHMKRMNMGTDGDQTLFWNVDKYGRVQNVKRFIYDENGNRIKDRQPGEPTYKIDNGYYPGLFNAHALSDPDKTVILVEAEKTAVLASYLFPDYIWIASGGKNLSYDKAIEMKGRNIIFFCDADEDGRGVISKMEDLFKKVGDCKFVSHDLFPERIDGYDVADLISERRNDLAVPESIITGAVQMLEDKYFESSSSNSVLDIDLDEAEEFLYSGKIDRGETTHFYELDNHWKWRRGFVYSLVGYSGMGKSELVKFLMLLKAIKDGWKICMFPPEDMISVNKKVSPLGVYNALIQMLTGKPLNPKDAMCLPRKEYKKFLQVIRDHFIIIYPEDGYPTQSRVIEEIQKLIDKGIHIDAVVVDPYNNMKTDRKSSEMIDEHTISQVKKAKSFAIKNDLCWLYAMHPPKITRNADKTISTPEFDEARGGAAFGNASDIFIAYNRPQFFMDGPLEHRGKEYPNGKLFPLAEINVRKVKDRDTIGCYPGLVQVDYEAHTRRYLNDMGVSPIDNDYKKDMTAIDTFTSQKFPEIKTDDVIRLFDSTPPPEEQDEDEGLPF